MLSWTLKFWTLFCWTVISQSLNPFVARVMNFVFETLTVQVPVEPAVSPQPTTPPLPKSLVYLLSKLSPVLLSYTLSVSVDAPRIEYFGQAAARARAVQEDSVRAAVPNLGAPLRRFARRSGRAG